MAKNKMSDLRDHLFDTLERLKSINDPDVDEKEKISIETAKTIVDVSDKIIEMWKVEVQAIGIIAKSRDASFVATAINGSGIFSDEIKALPAPGEFKHEPFR